MKLRDARSGLEILSCDECQALLHAGQVGRLAVASHGEPEIFPVNYAMDGGNVVFRTAPGTKLDAAVRTSRVAFEVDGIDPQTETGWSVIVRGRADEVLRASERRRLEELPLRPWADGEKDNWLFIRAEIVSGRRVGPPPGLAGRSGS